MNKRKVPKIRFKGFHDDWEQRKLADIVERITRKNENLESTLPLTISAQYGLIDQNEFFDKRIASKDVSGYYLVRKGEFAYNKSTSSDAPWGAIKRLDRYACGVLSTLYIVFRILDEDKVNSDYLVTYYDTDLWHKGVQAIAAEGARNHGLLNIAPADFFETTVSVPEDIEEQRKIGAYIMQLDHVITLHQKKCFEWKKSEFSSVSISWEQRKFEEAFIERREKTEQENEDILLSCAINGMFLNSELFGHFRGTTTIGYLRVKKNDLILSAQNLHLGNANVNLRFEHGIISPAYKVYDLNNCNPEFVQSWVKRDDTKNFFLAATTEGASQCRKNIEWETLGKQTIPMPSMDEQKQVGAFFSQLDHLITLHQRKLELLKRIRNSLVDHCFIGEKYTMSKKILYHGSPNRVIVPKFGFGEDRHDYGRGFYLTENLELAKEWAVCRPDEMNGWVHKYELEMDGLNILDFQKYDVLSWLAELMKHRDAADSRRYKMLAQKFIEKYGIDTCGYDVITGWRANASYFYIAKEFVRDNIDIEILEELLSLGGLGIQFCVKSERAFAQLSEVEQDIMSVDYSEFNDRYNERDINARNKMRALVDSDANKVTHVFSTLFER